MIDTSKTIGTKETFDPDRIRSLHSRGIITNTTNLEKAIFCLEYIGQLQTEGLDLIFKGGTAVQILLGGNWNRLSTDIDLCTDFSKKELETILERIHNKFDKKTFSFTPRHREIGGSIPFYLYIVDTPALTEGSRTLLLDAIGIKPKLPTQQTPLNSFFFQTSSKVTTLTIGALLGDKLSTIGPTTIGRPLVNSEYGLQCAKHFFDIGFLQQADFELEHCKSAYAEAIRIQSMIRSREYTSEECFNDMLFTCQVASLPQQVGDQAIKGLSRPQADRATSEFRILRNGLQRFRPFLVRGMSYAWDDLRYDAARTVLFMKMLNSNISGTKARRILSIKPPTTKEEILPLIEELGRIRNEGSWFIIPKDIENFPKILRTWHSFFFLDELV